MKNYNIILPHIVQTHPTRTIRLNESETEDEEEEEEEGEPDMAPSQGPSHACGNMADSSFSFSCSQCASLIHIVVSQNCGRTRLSPNERNTIAPDSTATPIMVRHSYTTQRKLMTYNIAKKRKLTVGCTEVPRFRGGRCSFFPVDSLSVMQCQIIAIR